MSDEWDLIAGTLSNPKFKWRTIDGVVEETGLDYTTVVNSMSLHEGDIIKSSIPSKDGKDLFTTREHYRKKRSLWNVFVSSVTNKVE